MTFNNLNCTKGDVIEHFEGMYGKQGIVKYHSPISGILIEQDIDIKTQLDKFDRSMGWIYYQINGEGQIFREAIQLSKT